MGRSVDRRDLGPLLHRAQPPRSLSLGRGPRREVGRHEGPGGQLRAALDPARAQRSGPDDRTHRRLPQARRRDRSRDGDHGAQPRGRLRHRPARPQHQDRRGRGRQKQGRDRGDRRLQLEPRDGAQVQSHSQERQGAGRIGSRLDRNRTRAHSPSRRLPHAHGSHLVLRVCHARLPRPRAAPRSRVPPGARQHMGQSAGPPVPQRVRCRAATPQAPR